MDKDIFNFLIEKAIKAPSGHNTQPWKFQEVGENSITVIPDFERQLPFVDPYNRELFISVGCAVENMRIAAESKGYSVHVTIDDINTTLRLEKNGSMGEFFLNDVIPHRQTNRGLYADKMLPQQTIKALEECGAHLYAKGTPLFDEITQGVLRGDELQMNNPCFRDELRKWMRFNEKDSQKSRDGLSYAVFGAPNMPRFISSTVMTALLRPSIQKKSDHKRIMSSSHFAVLSGADSIDNWINLGRRLERMLLTATKYSVAYAFLNQPCEEKHIAEDLKAKLSLTERPQIILRLGYATEATYSLRRPLETFIAE